MLLNGFLYWGLVVVAPRDNCSLGGCSCCLRCGVAGRLAFSVHLHQAGQVKLGLLQALDLADVDVVEGVDGVGGLLDVLGDGVGQELLHERLEVAGAHLAHDDLGHLGADLADLGGLSVGGLLDLVGPLVGVSDTEDAELVAVGGGDVDVAVDHGLPLLHHGAKLVTGQAHSVEVGEAVFALDILADEFEFPVGGLILMEISLVAFKDTSLKTIRSNLGSYSPGNQSLSNLTAVEHAWGFDIIPVLLGEGVDNLLFATLFTFSKPLVFTNSHD